MPVSRTVSGASPDRFGPTPRPPDLHLDAHVLGTDQRRSELVHPLIELGDVNGLVADPGFRRIQARELDQVARHLHEEMRLPSEALDQRPLDVRREEVGRADDHVERRGEVVGHVGEDASLFPGGPALR